MHRLMETYNEFAHGYHGFAALRTPAKYLEADGCGALHCQTRSLTRKLRILGKQIMSNKVLREVVFVGYKSC